MTARLEHGDMREVLARLHGEGVQVQSVVTDPPYHLKSIVQRFGAPDAAEAKAGTKEHHTGAYARASRGFMGKQWDGGDIAFRAETWRLCWELLPPGGHLIAFSGPRTYHRMACAIEDAGFEIRDMITDLVASDAAVRQFLESLNAEQQAAFVRCIDESSYGGMLSWLFGSGFPKSHNLEGEWDGWGTALKPAAEPIAFARKPLSGTVAATMAQHRTGALNIDACRIHGEDAQGGAYTVKRLKPGATLEATGGNWRPEQGAIYQGEMKPGRWPANVVHDGSPEVVAAFPLTAGQKGDALTDAEARKTQNVYGTMTRGNGRAGEASAANRYADRGATNFAALPGLRRGDRGSASRFFYSSKADATDRLGSTHPTVKPTDLMRWLVRLVTPPGGTVLDPFAGSGSTGMACLAEGFDCILVERESEYAADIERRIKHVSGGDLPLFVG